MSEVQEKKQEVSTQGKGSGKGKKAQAGDPPGYNPGGEKVLITAKQVKRNGIYNSVFFDMDVVVNTAAVLASSTYPDHTMVDQNHETRAVWNDLCLQLTSTLSFKQFGSTIRADLDYVAGHYGRNVAKRVVVPSGLLVLVRSWGTIIDDGGDFEVMGQPIIAQTMLLRGIGRPQEDYAGVAQVVDRSRSIGFDAGMPRAWECLISFAASKVNQWTHNRVLTIQSGALTTQVKGATLERGFDLFYQAFQTSNFPPDVLHALKIGNIAEGVLRLPIVPVGANIPGGIVTALNAEGVVCYYWRRDDIEMRFAEYYDTVQHRMHATLDRVFAMAEVTGMATKGDLSQLVNRTSLENAFCPVKIPGDQLEMGAMMSTTGSGFQMNEQVYRVEVPSSPLEMIIKWFDGMKRGKKKAAV